MGYIVAEAILTNRLAAEEVMDEMVTLLKWDIFLLLGGFALIVFYRILTGGINLQGLLWEKNGESAYSSGRTQSLVVTLAFAVIYLGLVAKNPDPTKLPEVPQEMLLVLGGSNLVYLGQKAYNLLSKLAQS